MVLCSRIASSMASNAGRPSWKSWTALPPATKTVAVMAEFGEGIQRAGVSAPGAVAIKQLLVGACAAASSGRAAAID